MIKLIQKLNNIRKRVTDENSLIHSITNPISINQCANAVLCVGARPIMAENPKEAAPITESSGALLLNLGNITDVRMEAMEISARTAAENNIPFVIDAVGVACSELRKSFAYELMKNYRPTVIKGNYSEINALYNKTYKSSGIDADSGLDTDAVSCAAVRLAEKYNCVILASGRTDIVTDGSKIYYIANGSAQLSRVTGTGCMLGVLCACYLSASPDIYAAVCAAAVMGICGELSVTDKGNGSFMVNLIDKLSVLTDEELKNNLKLEEREVEEV